jgi:hypothetical protein
VIGQASSRWAKPPPPRPKTAVISGFVNDGPTNTLPPYPPGGMDHQVKVLPWPKFLSLNLTSNTLAVTWRVILDRGTRVHAPPRVPVSPEVSWGINRLVCRPGSAGLSSHASPDFFGANDAPGCVCMRPPFSRGWYVYSGRTRRVQTFGCFSLAAVAGAVAPVLFSHRVVTPAVCFMGTLYCCNEVSGSNAARSILGEGVYTPQQESVWRRLWAACGGVCTAAVDTALRHTAC